MRQARSQAYPIFTGELAGWVLPSQSSGANAAWLPLDGIAYGLPIVPKRTALPEKLKTVRPKTPCFSLSDTVRRVVHRVREILLRLASEAACALFDAARVGYARRHP